MYRDGQLSTESWSSLAPRISPALGAARCDAAYVAPIAPDHAALWSAVEDYARSNGPTDELLAQLAPAANGDLILVVTVAGKVPEHHKAQASGDSPPPPTPTMGGRGGMGGGRGGGMGGGGGRPGRESFGSGASADALDLSASLYSVAEGRSVGLIGLEYSGATADDAFALFAAKVAQVLHGTRCVGWNWDAKIDADRLRQISEP